MQLAAFPFTTKLYVDKNVIMQRMSQRKIIPQDSRKKSIKFAEVEVDSRRKRNGTIEKVVVKMA